MRESRDRSGEKDTPCVRIGDGFAGYAVTVMGRAPVTETGDTVVAGGFRGKAPVTEIGETVVAGVLAIVTGVTTIGLNVSGLNDRGVGVPSAVTLGTVVIVDEGEVMVTVVAIMLVEVMVSPEAIMLVEVMVLPEDVRPLEVVPEPDPEPVLKTMFLVPIEGLELGLKSTVKLIPAGICLTPRPVDADAELIPLGRSSAMLARPLWLDVPDDEDDGPPPITTVMAVGAGALAAALAPAMRSLRSALTPTPLRSSCTSWANCWPVGAVWRIDSKSAVTL